MAIERPIVEVKGGTPIPSAGDVIRVNHDEPAREVPRAEVDEALFEGIEMSPEEREGRRKMEEFFALSPDQQKAKLAVVLDRGVIHDRLKVELPKDLHGEWCRNDPLEIASMQTKGFWVDTTYATRRSIHSDGSSANIVGDVIHMVTMRRNKEMIDRVRMEQSRTLTNGQRKQRKEDSEFVSGVQRDTDGIIPAFSESNERAVSASEVRAALTKADGQVGVQR